jgi:hypothetical protein
MKYTVPYFSRVSRMSRPMVITNRFVYVHMPKTGGTFVTEALKRVHTPPRPARSRWRLVRKIRSLLSHIRTARYGPLVDLEPKHGTCHDIPASHRHKHLVSTMRNPYDWYVSQYEFAWWKRTFMYPDEPYPTPVGYAIEQALPEFQAEYAAFPDISFEDFIQLCHRASLTYDSEGKLGLFTYGFVRYFYRDPMSVISRLDREYVRSGRHKADMFNVDLLHMHHLNQDLYSYLLSKGYAHQDIAFIQGLGKILPMGKGRQDHQRWEQYYTPTLKAFIRERDWALFEMFPEFDS